MLQGAVGAGGRWRGCLRRTRAGSAVCCPAVAAFAAAPRCRWRAERDGPGAADERAAGGGRAAQPLRAAAGAAACFPIVA